ncbi:PAS domain S-box protein [Halomicroarcula sp. F13]|uniref:PAS domain S-box protein n=1 Tax=Haloarcula rubra TaxID=2487747 RepID=A0AAW4PT62_9EURY|nr:PAS domain S-box protein [Halomicroarcula rubra]MBX0323354.1 PAS domain S-box protein [Halomicroarcula rubra]
MTAPRSTLTAALDGGPERVALLIDNDRNRELLATQLDDFEVLTPESLRDLPQFDVCLVDTATYPRVADQLTERRAEADPLFVPVLLVVGPDAPEHTVQNPPETVDDVLTVPTSTAVFENRLRSLLRIRRQSERLALFNRAIDDALTGITIASAEDDQPLQYVNDAFVEMTGYERSEILGRNCRFLQGPETDPEPVREMREAIDRGEGVTVELRNYRRDGTMFWNHVEIAPVFGPSGLTHFVGFQQDITERVEQARTLRQYEQIVRAAGDPIYSLDADLRFTLSNEATADLCDRAPGELTGEHVRTVLGRTHAAALSGAILELADAGASQTTIETTIRDAEGRDRKFQTAVAMNPASEFDGVVCVSRDVTSHRERESRLSVLDRVLRHNLRNKLHVVLAQVEFLREASDDEGVRTPAAAIERAATELLDLGDTAREFHETLDPSSTDHVGPMDVVSHVHHVIEEVRMGHTDGNVVASAPDEAWARAHDSLELALGELVENAVEYGQTDVTVLVDVTVEADAVVVTVTDDGPGMPEAEREVLAAGMESNLRHSTGLGLWFVRWMAINSGGSFDVRENDPTGTVVELRFPRADPPETPSQ